MCAIQMTKQYILSHWNIERESATLIIEELSVGIEWNYLVGGKTNWEIE